VRYYTVITQLWKKEDLCQIPQFPQFCPLESSRAFSNPSELTEGFQYFPIGMISMMMLITRSGHVRVSAACNLRAQVFRAPGAFSALIKKAPHVRLYNIVIRQRDNDDISCAPKSSALNNAQVLANKVHPRDFLRPPMCAASRGSTSLYANAMRIMCNVYFE